MSENATSSTSAAQTQTTSVDASNTSREPILHLEFKETGFFAKPVEKLGKHNWTIWKEQMIRVSRVYHLEPYLLGTIPEPDPLTGDPDEIATWKHNNNCAASFLMNNIEATQVTNVAHIQLASEMWKSLEDLFHTQADDEDDIKEHLKSLKESWEKLNMIGDPSFKMNDIIFKNMIAASLPRSWDSFTDQYLSSGRISESDPKRKISSQEFLGVLREEWTHQQTRNKESIYVIHKPHMQKSFIQKPVSKTPSLASQLASTPAKSAKSCENCGRKSHNTTECWWYGKEKCNKCGFFAGNHRKECSFKAELSSAPKRKNTSQPSYPSKKGKGKAKDQ
ncbi:hypothetical protein NP233_g11481 [Leucocoprinus birnbaumii]|uniref:Gag protein n=1 Tax=Leucocoprinus birnbaumii TaxID=56174 RepID=A0AAD5VK08_9AGAR|nr:hypothetical protein NP233_g11481 [Leucocoprinus birnbaumii]